MEHVWRYPFRPNDTSTLRTILLYGRCSTSGSDRGIAHFLTATRIQSREREEREQTNKRLGLTQVQKESYVTLCMCRLTLVWTLEKTSTKLLECRLDHDSIFFHWSGPSLMPTRLSAVPCRLVTRVTLRQLPSQSLCFTLWLASPHHSRSRQDRWSKTLCLVSRQNRQRNRLLGGTPT